MKHISVIARYLILILFVTPLTACAPDDSIFRNEKASGESDIQNRKVTIDLSDSPQLSYMVYYGELDDDLIETAKQYDIVILHPKAGNITREQVQRIRAGNTFVFGYISIGEDLRTAGMTPEQMLADERFTGDGTGPRVDPRSSEVTELSDIEPFGVESPAGTGYASYYLDDNDYDGTPDINASWTCAYTNIGDPSWYDELNQMELDGPDNMAGMKEILTDDHGRGLGCDGLFLDAVDTCEPNSYTADDSPNKTRFEWTAAGVPIFIERLKEEYPDKLVCQNRGLFFYNPDLPHYKYTPRKNVDFLVFENYMLDSNTSALYNANYYADNKYYYAPKLIAESGRPDGFKILSLDYAEGPEEYKLKDTLLGNSTAGMDILMEDINQTQNKFGFSHYISDRRLTLVNSFVIDHVNNNDDSPPVWSSVYTDTIIWPPGEPKPRIGIGETEPIENGMIVRWDIALDKNDITYTLYYQKEPFDFDTDPNLETAERIELVPEIGDGYADGISLDVYPYQATIQGLDSGEQYHFIIRAKDNSQNNNEEKNTVMIADTPL